MKKYYLIRTTDNEYISSYKKICETYEEAVKEVPNFADWWAPSGTCNIHEVDADLKTYKTYSFKNGYPVEMRVWREDLHSKGERLMQKVLMHMLKWNTIRYDNGEVEYFNIFRNIPFREAVEEIFRVPEQSREDIEEQVKRKAQWQFWSRCEYEIIVSEWPPSSEDTGYKLDVFEQLESNWERFMDYIYDCYCSGEYV